jgi:hypothetical protein
VYGEVSALKGKSQSVSVRHGVVSNSPLSSFRGQKRLEDDVSRPKVARVITLFSPGRAPAWKRLAGAWERDPGVCALLCICPQTAGQLISALFEGLPCGCAQTPSV